MRAAATISVGVAVLALTGCSQAFPQDRARASRTSSPTSTGSTSASPTSQKSSVTGAGTAAQSAATAGTAPRCRTAHLAVSLVSSEGAAGSAYETVRLTNTGTTPCSLYGYPGVSLVGRKDGTQIGAAGRRDTSVHAQNVTVPAGGSTTFVVRLGQAANYPRSTCSPVPADGFRIYPPGSSTALYLPLKDATGCASTSVDLLTVRPVGASAG